jgi:hypothetical protein
MVKETYTPLLSEVLKKVHNAKTKEKKVELLRQYDCEPLRMVIKSSFDPNIKWKLPNGEVPFIANEAEEGTEHTVLRKEARKLFNFIEGGNDSLAGFKRENMFVQMKVYINLRQILSSMPKIKNYTKCIKDYRKMLSKKHLVGMTIL